MGGSGKGMNLEQLFVVGYVVCFYFVLQMVVCQVKKDFGDFLVGVWVLIGQVGEGFGFVVVLEVVILVLLYDEVQWFVDKVYQVCFYLNVIWGNICVDVIVVDD